MSTTHHENLPLAGSSHLHEGECVGGGRYVLKKVLGQGGMGVVWLAHDKRLIEWVALKFLPAQIAFDPQALSDLRRETLRSRKLSHPNIIRIHDLYEGEGEPTFISMEYVDGPNLHFLRASKPGLVLNWKFVTPILRQLCAALEYAHGEKVVHRDLKPANLMLDGNGRLKLADFGIACLVHDTMTRVTGLTSGGTLDYMSPQQADGRGAQTSDDIYALGATVYDLLTSKPPFFRGDVAYQLRHNRPDPMAHRLADLELANEIPAEVEAMVMACLAKEPEQRPPNARAILDWLDTAANAPIAFGPLSMATSVEQTTTIDSTPPMEEAEAPILHETERPAARTGRTSSRWWWVTAAVVGSVVAIALLAVVVRILKASKSSGLTQTSITNQPPTASARSPLQPVSAPTRSLVPTVAPVVTNQYESPVPHRGAVHSVAFSPNGYLLASGGDDHVIHIWLPRHRRHFKSLSGHTGPVRSVAFSPVDSRLLASGSSDQMLKLWDVSGDASPRNFPSRHGAIHAVKFSKDGAILYSGSAQGKIEFRRTSSGQVEHTLAAHDRGVNFLALSPDGKLLASAGGDATIKLWDAQTGVLHRTFENLPVAMTCLAFAPDERTLAACGGEERYHLFDLPLGIFKRSSYSFRAPARALVYQPDGEWLIVSGNTKSSGLKLAASDGGLRSSVFPNSTGEITALAMAYDGLCVYGTELGVVGMSRYGFSSPATADPFSPPEPTRAVKIFVAAEPPAQAAVPPGWERINFEGPGIAWALAGPANWSSRDGVMTTQGQPSALVYPKPFVNVEFKADVKFSFGSVAALAVRVPPGGHVGVMSQVLNDVPPNITTAPSLPEVTLIHNNIAPHDQWVSLHIVVTGKWFRVFLNDRLTVNMSPARTPPEFGQLALMQNAPNGSASFRNVMVKPLSGGP
jgi:serine/threonine protein kinase